MITLWCWRHPRCDGARGRCIGRTDLRVDPRRAKRLAHRIRAVARREALPCVVHCSPLQRCLAVARILKRWGWQSVVDPGWSELDFGGWEGRCWADISAGEVAAWEAEFPDHAPGGGESLRAMQARVAAALARHAVDAGPLLLVAHAGVMQLLVGWATDPRATPTASTWPPAPPHGRLRRIALPSTPLLGDTHA